MSAMRVEKTLGGESFEIDAKRFYVPGARLVGVCPECGAAYERDLGRHYLSHPVANAPFEHTCWCGECNHEWPVTLRLDLALSVVG